MKKTNRHLKNLRVKLPQGEAMAFAPVVRGVNRLEVVFAAESNDPAEIVLLGSVGKSWWDDSGITEKEFRAALDAIPKGKPITVKLNSEGGSVQEGLGIYNAIKERAADITCRITGYALSIASVFPLAAGKVISPKSAIWMIHCAWSWAQGNAEDMRQQAEMLDKHDQSLIDIYSAHTGKSKSELRAAMEKETWLTGNEAVEYGLATEGDDEEVEAQAAFRPLSKEYIGRCKNLSGAILNFVSKKSNGPVPHAGSALPSLSALPPQGERKNTNQNQTNIMTRAQIIALLKTWGVPTNDGMTDEQLSALVSAGKPAAPANDSLETVKAQLATERKARITSEVTRRAENKIKNDQLDKVIAMAMADEAGAYSFIDSLPVAANGSDPLGVGQVEIGDGAVLAGFGKKPTASVENIFKTHSTPKARYDALKENYANAMAEANRKDGCKPGVFNANSYSATLTTNFLVMGATIQAGPKFAPIRAMSRDVSVDPYKPLASGVMKFTTSVQDGSDVQTNATNFTTGDSTVTAVTIAVSQYTASANLTNKDLNSGIRMEDIALPKLRSLGSKVVQNAVANITAANFATLPKLVCSPTAFGFGELQTLMGNLKKANKRNLIVDGEYLARLTNVPTFFQVALRDSVDGTFSNAFGWDLICMNTEWSTADANVRGFAADEQAIGVIAGLPIIDNAGIPGGILSVSTGSLPGANLPIAAYLWFDVNARTYYMSYDIMFGSSKLDGTVGNLITSA